MCTVMGTYMVFLSIHSRFSGDVQSRGFGELLWIRYVT